jgi:hypothetical protein
MIVEGQQGVMLLTADGHYAFYALSSPVVGQKALLFPAPGDSYFLLDLADSTAVGEKIVIVEYVKDFYCGLSPG